MRKFIGCVAIAMALVACDKENSRHEIVIAHPGGGSYGLLYADQTKDSVVFYTFDSYKATVMEGRDWTTLDKNMEKADIENIYNALFHVSIPVTFAVNTTGESRMNHIVINNYGDGWNESVSTGFMQVGWLNVTRPMPVVTESNQLNYKATFDLKKDAKETLDSICFYVNGDWSMSVDKSFVTLSQTTGMGGNNLQNVKLTLLPNEASESRQATIILESSGVKTPITVTQEAAKKEEK